MRASFLMFFGYVTMIGVPVLLVAFALSTLFFPDRVVQAVLLILIAAGTVVYGAIGIREVFVHGGRKRESSGR
jgi:hypothetical protein